MSDTETETTPKATSDMHQQPSSSLLADAFAVALEAVPADDWCRTWPADRTMMLRTTIREARRM
jgi:hypothetical protein